MRGRVLRKTVSVVGRKELMSRDFRVLFLYPNIMMSALIPSSISILSSVLKEEGFAVDLFDTTFYKTQDTSANEQKVKLLQVKPFDFGERGIRLK